VRVQAALLRKAGGPVEIVDVELEPPHEGEALVRVAACGVRASDLHVGDGDIPEPLPLVLGHEASGVVVDTGPKSSGSGPATTSCSRWFRPATRTTCRRGRPNFSELGDRMAATGTLADRTSRLSVGRRDASPLQLGVLVAEYAVVPEPSPFRFARTCLSTSPRSSAFRADGLGRWHQDGGSGGGGERRVLGQRRAGAIQAARFVGADPIVEVHMRSALTKEAIRCPGLPRGRCRVRAATPTD